MPSAHGTGYFRDPQSIANQIPYLLHQMHGILTATEVPTEGGPMRHTPHVLDQDGCGACVGHAVALALETRLTAMGTPLPHRADPWGVYALARCVDRSVSTQPLRDIGTQPYRAVEAIEQWGVPIARKWTGYSPDDPRFMVEGVRRVNEDPKLGQLQIAAERLAIGAYAIHSYGRECILDFCRALAAGFPICVGVDASIPAWQEYAGGVLEAAPPPPGAWPNHYVMLDYYERQSGGRILFYGQNSWGSGWGSDGRFCCSQDFLLHVTDPRVFDVHLE